MSQNLKPKLNFLPLFLVLLIAISLVIAIFTWSHYEQRKTHAHLILNQSIQSQKVLLTNLMLHLDSIKSSRNRKKRTAQTIEQIEQIWISVTNHNPQIRLQLWQKVPSDTHKSEASEKPLISTGQFLASSLPTVITNTINLLPSQYSHFLLQPKILNQQIELLDQQYTIHGEYQFPSFIDFLHSISLYIAAAFVSAILFSWFSVYIWRGRLLRNIDNAHGRYQQFVLSSNDWLWEIDKYGNLIYCGDNTKNILGYSSKEMLDQSLYSFLYPKTAKEDEYNLETYISNGANIRQLEIHLVSKNGHPVLLSMNAAAQLDSHGQVISYRGTGRDLTEERQKQDSIISMVYFDSLTQLPNRESLVQRLDIHLNEVIQRKGLILSALVFIDLDDFKDINDYQGQITGNKLLQEIAQRLKRFVSDKDVIYRLSGDQFVILVISPNKMLMTEFKLKLETFVREVLDLINRPVQIDEHNALVSASAGIALIPQDGRTTSELLSHADSAMYQAKRDGKDRYCYFDASMREQEDHRRQIAKDLKQAIENKEFQLHYQLQIDSDTDELYGMEALIRWPSPTRNAIVTPDEFIQVATESNHIQAIDEWVIKQAAKDLAKLRNATNKTVPVSINLSSKTIENPKLPAMLKQQIEQYHLSPTDMRVEVTETGLLRNMDKTIEILNTLKDNGFSSSIDDFGTGYSSLSYLQKLPVDTLKIDKSFIDGIGSNDQDLQICKSIINLAKTLNKKLIAEGVQTEVQKELLKAEGCSIIQGYLYSTPIPIAEVIIELTDKESGKKTHHNTAKQKFTLMKRAQD